MPLLLDARGWVLGPISARLDPGDHVAHLIAMDEAGIHRPEHDFVSFAAVKQMTPRPPRLIGRLSVATGADDMFTQVTELGAHPCVSPLLGTARVRPKGDRPGGTILARSGFRLINRGRCATCSSTF